MKKNLRELALPYFILFLLVLLTSFLSVDRFSKVPSVRYKAQTQFKKKDSRGKQKHISNKDYVLAQPVFLVGLKENAIKEMISFKHAYYSFNLQALDKYVVEYLPAGTALFLTDEMDEQNHSDLLFKYKNSIIRFKESHDYFQQLFDPTHSSFPNNWTLEYRWVQDQNDLVYLDKIIQDASVNLASFKMNKCISIRDLMYDRINHRYNHTKSFLNSVAESDFNFLKSKLKTLKIDQKIILHSFSINEQYSPAALCLQAEFDGLLSYLLLNNLPR